MPAYDELLRQLRHYRPERTAPPDFDDFWQATREKAKAQPLNAALEPADSPTPRLDAHLAAYDAFDRGRIRAWYLAPNRFPAPRPALVFLHDYLDWRGRIYRHLLWALQGFIVLAPDHRAHGDSSDLTRYPEGGPKGDMTKGIKSQNEYYLRGVYADALRAVEFLGSRKEVDSTRIGFVGYGLGAAAALMACANDRRPATCVAVAPTPCHCERLVAQSGADPIAEIVGYVARYPEEEERVQHTLRYFDPLNGAERIQCPTFFVLGLKDGSAPPQTTFAVYNHLKCEKTVKVYPYDGHAAGADVGKEQIIRWAQERLKP